MTTIRRGATGSWGGEITAGDAVMYEVRPGDSLSIIARDVLGDVSRWPEIAALNNIREPYIIEVGQLLELPRSRAPAVQLPARTQTTATAAPTVQLPAGGVNWVKVAGYGAIAVGLFYLFS